MIILIAGASHTGKTALSQKILEKYKYPYLSIDHLKMGLIRSKNTDLTPMSSNEDLATYLWPIVSEMIKTAIENKQNLVVEGCYIPFDWAKDFEKDYLDNIKYICLIMSEKYIRKHFADIKKYANVIEKRIDDDWCTMESVLKENAQMLKCAKENKVNYILIDEKYEVEVEEIMNADEYSRKAKEQWGETFEYKEYEKKTSNQSIDEQKEAWKNLMLIFVEFGKMKDMTPDHEEVQLEVKKLQDYISEHFYTCSNVVLKGLGSMYASGGEFTENIDKAAGDGTAVFVAKAIEIYCG